jgi:hypothetical protein
MIQDRTTAASESRIHGAAAPLLAAFLAILPN